MVPAWSCLIQLLEKPNQVNSRTSEDKMRSETHKQISCYETKRGRASFGGVSKYTNACYCTRLGVVRAASRASALPFKRRAQTNRCGCSESACGGIVGRWDAFFTAAGIHPKQNVVVAAAKSCGTRWRLGRRRAISAAKNATTVAQTLAQPQHLFVLL